MHQSKLFAAKETGQTGPTRKASHMTGLTLACHSKKCEALPYCSAMESMGLKVPGNATCFFRHTYEETALEEEVLKQCEGIPEKRELLSRLMERARHSLAACYNKQSQHNATEELLPLHDALFFARLSLWSAMATAAKAERSFTDVELTYYQEAIAKALCSLKEQAAHFSITEQVQALAAHDHKLREDHSLLFDAQMIRDINRVVGNMITARPTLIVGDKGIAKTQVAKFAMNLFESNPLVISVKGDMMSDELIGKIKHDVELNTFVFKDGPLLTAMKNGIPLLLDEINFGDQAIIARLQDILLKKPGDLVFVQESGEAPFVVQPGFSVIATANEASLRYRHREVLDPAIRDRFDVIARTYPNLDCSPFTDIPPTLLRLALSSAVDEKGVPSEYLSLSFLEDFARLSFVSQYLYVTPAKEVTVELTEDSLKNVVLEESQPLLTDCITPRAMSSIIEECRRGNLPDRTLNQDTLDNLIKTLDQAGSTRNYLLMQSAKVMLAFNSNPVLPIQEKQQDLLVQTGAEHPAAFGKDELFGLSKAAKQKILAHYQGI